MFTEHTLISAITAEELLKRLNIGTGEPEYAEVKNMILKVSAINSTIFWIPIQIEVYRLFPLTPSIYT